MRKPRTIRVVYSHTTAKGARQFLAYTVGSWCCPLTGCDHTITTSTLQKAKYRAISEHRERCEKLKEAK